MRKTCLAKRLSGLALLSHMGICLSAYADVWEFHRDGSVTTHRGLDYQQRANLHANWRPLSKKAIAEKQEEYRQLVGGMALAYDVDERLVYAIIEVESAYDPNAVSKAGAMGLMQLMPATAERFGVRDPLDPGENIEAGVRYLEILYNEFQDTELVLAAYNAGEKAVRRYDNSVPPFPETRGYIERVLAVLDRERPDASK